MQACPTNALVVPKVVDARLCISYLTIENKGSIPEHLRPLIGKQIFGCDICQEVCPWNSKAKKLEGLPAPDWDLWAPHLDEAILLTQDAFKEQYQNSPVLRTKHRGFIRNVAIALGNWGSNQAALALKKAQRIHKDEVIQEHISWALLQCDRIRV